MVSRFESDLLGTSAWNVLLSPFGETVTVQPGGTGPTSTVQGRFQPESISDRSYEDASEIEQLAHLQLAPADVATVAGWTPATGDLVTARAIVYAVEKLEATAPLFVLALRKITPRRYGGGDVYEKGR